MSGKQRRRRNTFFDRVKILIILGVVIGFFVWKDVNDPFTTLGDSFADFAGTSLGIVLLALFGLEVLRQLHYLLAELWAGYNHLWTERIFAGSERQLRKRVGDFTRYRVRRLITWGVLIVIYGFIAMLLRDDVGSVAEAIVRAPEILLDLLPVILQFMFFGALVMFQFVAIFWFLSRGGIDIVFPQDIETRFDGVWGQDHVLDLVRENIAFLERPDDIEAKGGYIPGGILLWGPPGTGKTLMAEAIAGEVGKPFVFVDPGAFIQMFFGVGILKVKRLFRKLRKLSLRHGGVVVFFDEADSLGNRGMLAGGPGPFQPHEAPAHTFCNGTTYLSAMGQKHVLEASGLFGDASTSADDGGSLVNRIMMGAGMGGGGGMGTLQALLTEISGLTKPRGLGNRIRRILGMKPKPPPKYRILIIMATNMPNSLDQALLRPGRIDRIYKVGYPSKEGRLRTFEGYLAKVKNDLSTEEIDKIATTTAYYSGAKIKDLVNEALILAIRDDRDTVSFSDIWRAKALKEMGPPEDAEYIVRERHAVAIHEASHAVAAHLLSTRRSIDMVTIERRGNVGGFVRSLDIEDRFTSWKTELESDIKVSLASLAGERMFFDSDNSSGVTGDLRSATQLVSYMQGVYGMGDQLASFLGLSAGQFGGGGDPAEKVIGSMGKKVEAKLKELYDEVYQLLHEHREKVLELAHVLVDERTISGDRVTEVMGTEPGLIGIHEPEGFGAFDPERKPLDASQVPLPLGSGVNGEPEASDGVREVADEIVED